MSEEIHPEQPLSLEKEGSSEDENLGILSASRAKRDPSLYSRREGDSSDDEKNDESSIVVEEIEDNDGIENGDEEGDGYQALEEEDDDFGDFHGFLQDDAAMKSMLDSAENDNFANFYSSRCQKDLQKSPFPLKSQASAEKKLADNLSLPQNISIPPLSREQIDAIKAAMSGFDLKPPSLTSITIAEAFERSKVRIGDEFS